MLLSILNLKVLELAASLLFKAAFIATLAIVQINDVRCSAFCYIFVQYKGWSLPQRPRNPV